MVVKSFEGDDMDDILSKMRLLVNENLNKIKSIQSVLRRVESHLKNSGYITATKVINEEFTPIVTRDYPQIDALVDELIGKINERIRRLKLDFDRDFISACESAGILPVVGDTRKGFRIKGIIEVLVDFERGRAIIGTESKKNTIKNLRLSDLIKEVQKVNKRLFKREWIASEFIKNLYGAYLAAKGQLDKEIPLRDVQAQLWMRNQSESFWKTLDNGRLAEYPTDEFSVDLGKLLASKPLINDNLYFRLSEGAAGITVYDTSGNFRSFKFLTFTKRGQL